jgi:hypothetical protein
MYAIRAYKISRLINTARELADELRLVDDELDIDWWKNPSELEAPLRKAATLAQGSPRLMAKVFDATIRLMDEPTLTPDNEAKLVKVAKSVARTDYDRERLRDRTQPDSDGLGSSLPENFGSPAVRTLNGKTVAMLRAAQNSTNRPLYRALLVQFATMGCQATNWKSRNYIGTVLKHINAPEELVAVIRARPEFPHTVARLFHQVRDFNRLYDQLTAASEQFPVLAPARLTIAKAIFALTPLPLTKQSDLLTDVATLAARDPDYRAALVADTLGKVVYATRHGRSDTANDLLDLANRVSGSPLAPFSALASRELYFWSHEQNGRPVRSFITSRHDVPLSDTVNITARTMLITQDNRAISADTLADLLIQPPLSLADPERARVHNLHQAHAALGKGQPLLRVWAELCKASPIGDVHVAKVLASQPAQLKVPKPKIMDLTTLSNSGY